ncbi:flagellar hook-associated protein FlgL [Endozoicomonas ascidiicola]|uniref:flagellar hook-associated protein FlgL n=1 Tax=Endozoicomonas ascidiicola TaxID=1698521 RepID=UPI00082B13A8|nr:flagellar hook-associated protein FlgL [Endozoicomonas ascidiicola]
MRISTLQMHTTMNSSMQQASGKINESLLKMLSGKEILKPSDDPLAALQIMGMSDDLTVLEQYQKNITSAQSSLTAEETVLNDVDSTLNRLRDLTLSAGNDALSQEDMNAIAGEVDHLIGQLSDMANTKSANGEYLFAGMKSDTMPVIKKEFTDPDTGIVTEEWVYEGGDESREIPISDNRTITQGDTADDIFFSADGGSIFADLDELSTALKAGDRTALKDVLDGSIESIDKTLADVGSTLTSVGARINTLDMTTTANEESIAMTTALKGSLEDLDYAEAITQLTLEQTALQASQKSYGKVSQLSLFNYI